jgi:hypothetical protein
LLSIRQVLSERIENVKKLEGVVFDVSDEVVSEEKVSLDLGISSPENYFDVPKYQRSEHIEERLDNVKEALEEKIQEVNQLEQGVFGEINHDDSDPLKDLILKLEGYQ